MRERGGRGSRVRARRLGVQVRVFASAFGSRADRVSASYIWNTAQNASEYVQLDFGVFFSELAATFRSLEAGTEPYAARLVVGHDGSMIRLASGLGLGAQAPGLRWPGMGSEIVFEVWKTKAGARFVRVLHEGTPVDALAWVPFDALVAKLEGLVPSDIFAKCNA
jgi:hypothetical protein